MPPGNSDEESEGHYFSISGHDDGFLNLVDPGNGLSYTVKFSDMQNRVFQPIVQLVTVRTSRWSRSTGLWESLALTLTLSVFVVAIFKLFSLRQR